MLALPSQHLKGASSRSLLFWRQPISVLLRDAYGSVSVTPMSSVPAPHKTVFCWTPKRIIWWTRTWWKSNGLADGKWYNDRLSNSDSNSYDLEWLSGHAQFLVQQCSNWHDFNWHSASRGPSAIAELLVYPLDAMTARYYRYGLVSVCLSVCLSVCMSVTSRCSMETAGRIELFWVPI